MSVYNQKLSHSAYKPPLHLSYFVLFCFLSNHFRITHLATKNSERHCPITTDSSLSSYHPFRSARQRCLIKYIPPSCPPLEAIILEH